MSAADTDACDGVIVLDIPLDHSIPAIQLNKVAALALCATDLFVLCIDCQDSPADLSSFETLIQVALTQSKSAVSWYTI